MCICIYIYIHICIHVYIYTYQYICTYIMWTYMHVYYYLYRARKLKVPTSVLRQIWICTKSLFICTADLRVYGALWHRTNSNEIQIYRTKIMTTCRVLYLSDSPERIQICWEIALTAYNTYSHIYIYEYTWLCKLNVCVPADILLSYFY